MSPVHPSLDRTVKKLRLTRALTLPEATAVSEACRRMAARRVDAALLTDANGMLSGILTAEEAGNDIQLAFRNKKRGKHLDRVVLCS
jgi:CBS domain containing-hemolysin-like protein